MSKTSIQFILLAIVLVILQVIVFNRICLWGYAVPFAFLYILLRLPLKLSMNWVLTIGFFLGLTVDIFSDTQGMNALACTISASLLHPVLKLYYPREEDISDQSPSIRTLGFPVFAKFTLTISLIYCILIFVIEAFTFFNVIRILVSIASSTILTSAVLLAIDSLTYRTNEKRL